MPRYKLTIEYDGTDFHGWQRQSDGYISVQEIIENSFSCFINHNVTLQVAGRTDAGVHARGQVAHCDLADKWDAYKLYRAVNANLSMKSIAILRVDPVADLFSARFDAIEKCYMYRIVNRYAHLTFDHGYSWHIYAPLDIDSMRKASSYLEGCHDFSSFCGKECPVEVKRLRTLNEIAFNVHGDYIDLLFKARSFLYNQVRIMTGTIVAAGMHAIDPVKMPEIIAARDRRAANVTAPACGLYLMSVKY